MNRRLLEAMPLPIARAYRQMYDHGSAAESYQFIALFMEPLLKWYGSLALVTLRAGFPEKFISLAFPRNLTLSLGHWLSPLQTAVQLPAGRLPAHWQPLERAFEELRAKAATELKDFIAAVEAYAGTTLAKRSVFDFLAATVLYRNRTRGHGAPTLAHQQQFAPLLLAAYETMLQSFDCWTRLNLIYVERAEILGTSCVHSLRECQGLFSALLNQRLTTPKAQAMSSQALYLFNGELTPLVELTPLLIRPAGRDAIYFLNSAAGGTEYLCYDNSAEEFHRPETYLDAVRDFFGAEITPAERADGAPVGKPTPTAAADDLGFGNLGMW